MKKHLLTLTIALCGLVLLSGMARSEEPKQEGKFFGKVYFDYFHDF